MPPSAERRSPVHHLLETRGPQWGQVGGASLALAFAPPEAEAAALRALGLCDVSVLPRLGLKGPGAEGWLREHGILIPAAVYDTSPLGEAGFLVRLGAADFLLEGGFGEALAPLAADLDRAPPGVHRVERQDACFLLTGARAPEVLAQVCSIDFRTAAPRRLVLTRAAAINCGVLPDPLGDVPLFRLWVDFTYGVYFWEALAGIAEELGGRVIGAAVIRGT